MAASLILASASPRRHTLLDAAGIPHEVSPSDIEEIKQPAETPEGFVLRMALEKAEAAAQAAPDRFVLAADTVVVLDGAILGKPETAARATAMLDALNGRAHAVVSGVALLRHSPFFLKQEAVSTKVFFRQLTREEIQAYVATGECLDKAGAYGIQAQGGTLVARYEGSFTNVVGLPMETVKAFLAEAGAAGLSG